MDITVDRRDTAPARRRRRVPWSPRAWGEALYLAAGIPVQVLTPIIVVGLLAWPLSLGGPGRFLGFLLMCLVCLGLLLLLTPSLTRVQRHRMATTAGVEIPPQRRWRGLLTWHGLRAVLRSESTWRQFSYHLLIAPALAAAGIIAVGLWPAGIVTVIVAALAWTHPLGGTTYGLDHTDVSRGLLIAVTFAGVAGLFTAPWLTSGVRALDARASRGLLGPSRADELEHRVEQLTETR
ncbi:MAG: sensor domain-containing protein, partial [Trebonia sp.]